MSAPTPAITTDRRVSRWLLILGAGIIAGVLSGLGGEATGRAIPVTILYPADYARISGYQKVAVDAMILGKAQAVVERKKAAASYGLLGVVLGVCLAFAGGLAGGSIRSGVWGAVVGAMAGAVAGVALSAAFVPMFFRFQDPDADATIWGLLLLFVTHGGMFAGVGASSGLALGWGMGDRRIIIPALIGGLFGGLLGAFAFEVINSLAFPLVRTFQPVPVEPIPRLLAQLCAAVGISAFAGLTALAARARLTSTSTGSG